MPTDPKPIPKPIANGPPKAPGGPKSPGKPSGKVRMPPRAYDRKKPRLPAGSLYRKEWDGAQWQITLHVPIPGRTATQIFYATADASFYGEAQVDKLYRRWLATQEAARAPKQA